MTALAFKQVEAIGSRVALSTHGDHVVPVYPDDAVCEGIALRDLRLERDYGLREAAGLLGLEVIDLAALERGRARFVDRDAAWREVEARLPDRSVS